LKKTKFEGNTVENVHLNRVGNVHLNILPHIHFDDASKGKLIGNYLARNEKGSGPMFYQRKDGTIVTNLEGYAVVPLEQFAELLMKAGESPIGVWNAKLKRFCG